MRPICIDDLSRLLGALRSILLFSIIISFWILHRHQYFRALGAQGLRNAFCSNSMEVEDDVLAVVRLHVSYLWGYKAPNGYPTSGTIM